MSVKVFHQLAERTLRNERKFQIFIQESFFDFIPRGVKKPVYKEYLKEILYAKYGESAFLDPEKKLFPIKNINTGLYDHRLIQYALIRTIMLKRIDSYYENLYNKALQCFNKHKCQDSVNIVLLKTGEKIPIIKFLLRLESEKNIHNLPLLDDAYAVVSNNKKKKHHGKYKRLEKSKTHKI